MPRTFKPFACLTLMLGLTLQTAEARQTQHEPHCVPTSNRQIAALFDRWNDSLDTKNPDAVVANYAPAATLLPTVQNGPLIGRAAIRDYFVYFLKQSPHGTIGTRVIHIGCNIAHDIGLYTFSLDGDQAGSRTETKARYTFVYAPSHGTWLIVHHHSSAVPVEGK